LKENVGTGLVPVLKWTTMKVAPTLRHKIEKIKEN